MAPGQMRTMCCGRASPWETQGPVWLSPVQCAIRHCRKKQEETWGEKCWTGPLPEACDTVMGTETTWQELQPCTACPEAQGHT
jgi:hypothetical protein